MLVASTDCKAEVGVVSSIPLAQGGYSYFREYITRRLHALGHAARDESTADFDGVSLSRPPLIGPSAQVDAKQAGKKMF